jgi:hypothetical protein
MWASTFDLLLGADIGPGIFGWLLGLAARRRADPATEKKM